jgi:hypothetical protein
MTVRIALVLALAGVAAVAAAEEPYAPPGMTFGPAPASPAPPAPAAPASEPSAAPTTASRVGFGLGLLAGRVKYSDATQAAFFGVGLEALVLADLGRFVAGGMGTIGSGMGAGISAAGGARLGVAPALRVDLLADLGLATYYQGPFRPVVGARTGLTWVRASGSPLTVGVALRHRLDGNGAGATIAGGFFTWGGAPDARR